MSASLLRVWWNNTKELPFPVGMLCQGGMIVGPVLLAFLVLPIVDWTVNGLQMSYRELWKSGAGFVAMLFLLFVTVGTWGMAARSLISRWALVAVPIIPHIASLPFLNSGWVAADDGVLVGLLSGCFMAALIYGCLFHLPSIRHYFSLGQRHRDGQAA